MRNDADIQWQISDVRTNTEFTIIKGTACGEPWKNPERVGNVLQRNAEQYDLYTRRTLMSQETFERRTQNHYFVYKQSLAWNANKLLHAAVSLRL